MSHKSTFHYGTATTCLLEVVEKDALIQEKEKLYVQLKNIIARLSIAACSLYIYIYVHLQIHEPYTPGVTAPRKTS